MSDINLRNITEKQELSIMVKDYPEIENLLQVYPPEMASLLINNKEKIKNIVKVLENFNKNTCTNTMVMQCSDKCVYKEVCVLFKNGLAPVGYPCPIEKKLIMELEFDITKSLDIDRNDPIEMEMLWDLIDAKILDMRSSGALKNGTLVQIVEQKVGPSSTVTREEISPNIEVKLELKKLKHSIIDSFVATRRAKKKYGMQSDPRSLEQMIKDAASRVED